MNDMIESLLIRVFVLAIKGIEIPEEKLLQIIYAAAIKCNLHTLAGILEPYNEVS